MLMNETTMSLTEAAAYLPRVGGKRVHPSTIWRWIRRGCGGVRLESRRLGARFVTSAEAIERFSEALAAIELPNRGPVTRPTTTTERKRQRDIERAEAELEADGV